MKKLLLRTGLSFIKLLPGLFLLSGLPAFSQQLALVNPSPAAFESVVAIRPATVTLPQETSHRFWDRENRILFAAVAASSTADFAVTYSNLQNGGRELDPVTRLFSGSTAGLAMNFAGETAGVIGLSYFFHKTGHHKLERIVSMVNVSSSLAAVSYDRTH
ncbi:MAG TPA: hypothetical protein VEG68_08845 [Terriglobales bacterium]|nr:hypothetical protein [Terriglobales bacterium]